jgi:hypothetical protein
LHKKPVETQQANFNLPDRWGSLLISGGCRKKGTKATMIPARTIKTRKNVF